MSTTQTAAKSSTFIFWLLLTGGFLVSAALWLRWQYVANVGIHVDEFTTLWASKRILETGAPIMPSGALYARGLVVTYLIAAFAWVSELSYVVGRLPSLLFGVGAVAAILLIGRREWNARVGWLAAVGLILLPEAIEASGRARFYSALLFFTLLAIWSAYAAVRVDSDAAAGRSASWRGHLLFALCFVLALFSQEQMALLVPSLLLGMVLWRGWRYLLQPAVLTAWGLCLIAVALRYWLEIGSVGEGDIVQGNKAFVALLSDVPGAWVAFGHLYVAWGRLPWTLFALVALLAAATSLWRGRGRLRRLSLFHQATLFFALQWLSLLAILFFLVGSSWRDSRYAFLVQPCWLLMGAAGVVWLVERVLADARWQWAAVGAVTLVLAWQMWPLTQKSMAQEAEGYQQALEFVASHRQADDIVLSPQPTACAFVMGAPCDFYARELDLGSYVVERDGVQIDRWTGAPLLDSAVKLEQAVQSASRVWLVVDGERLGRRYGDAFLRSIVQHFDPAYKSHDVVALLASGWRTPPPYGAASAPRHPLHAGPLDLTSWQSTAFAPGQYLFALLNWQQRGNVEQDLHTSLQLVGPDGVHLVQHDGPLARGLLSTADGPKTTVPDPKVLSIPADLAPGRYRLEIVVYDLVTKELMADPQPIGWFFVGAPPAAPALRTDATWRNQLDLVGYDELPMNLTPGADLPVRLVWSAAAQPDDDYTVFVHLLDANGAIIAQSDHAPERGFYPTSVWQVGEWVEDLHTLTLPATLPPGQIDLHIGWYHPQSGERLRAQNGADSILLGQWSRP